MLGEISKDNHRPLRDSINGESNIRLVTQAGVQVLSIIELGWEDIFKYEFFLSRRYAVTVSKLNDRDRKFTQLYFARYTRRSGSSCRTC
jgi:hypothetical protein